MNASNSGGQFRTQQTGVGRLKGNPSDGSQSEIDGRWRVLLLLEVDPVAQNDGAAQCQPRFGTVPVDEVGDGAVVSSLAAFGGKAFQDRRFGLFEVGKG